MKDKNNKNVFHYLNEVSGKTKWNILLLLIIQGAHSINSIVYALYLREIINSAVSGNESAFRNATICFICLVLIQLALLAWNRYLQESTRSQLENRFKSRLFQQLLYRQVGKVSSVHTGEWLNRLTNDTKQVADALTDIIPGIAGMTIRMIGAVAMIIVLEPRFLYLVLPGGILLIVCSTVYRKVMKQLHRTIQEKDGIVRIFLQEAISNLLIVRSYAVENVFIKQAQSKMEEHRKARMHRNHFSNISNVGFGIVMNGAYVLGAVFCGYGILKGEMDYGTFTAVLQLISQVQSPFANISGYFPRYQAMIASTERLMEIEIYADETKIAEQRSLQEVNHVYDASLVSFGIKDISFAYRNHVNHLNVQSDDASMSPVLRNLSIDIQKGEYIAFTGRSGCGKSTILKLLMCLYAPDQGTCYLKMKENEILLDETWSNLFAYVPQGNALMSGTIREIISLADHKNMYDEERMKQALSIACADDFVYAMEKGVDSELGERGLGLSEGQMQRIAIARAIFSDHPILMLDECTSALDEQTEKNLLMNLRKLTSRTVLIVTHRDAVFSICDKVCDFKDDGTVEIRKAGKENEN